MMLGFPWYNGPDVNTYPRYFEMCHYLGRLQERCEWLNWIGDNHGSAMQVDALNGLRKLDLYHDAGAEITLKDDVIFEFGQCNQGGLSLPGLARERLVESALTEGYEWLLMWDDDMLFDWSMFLRLWRHNKPVCAALAFTSREPVLPVIYRVREVYEEKGIVYKSDQVLDYPKDQLIGGEDIGGSLGFGAGVVLFNMSVFRQLGKPWFYSTGCGEDWMFCVRCHQSGIPRYMDTSVKTMHAAHRPRWFGEQAYERNRKENPEAYERYMEVV